jgi:hypothetical protein
MNPCDDCPKQQSCEYGFIVTDKIEKRKMALWEKYIMLQPPIHNSKRAEWSNKFSKRKFIVDDVDWLTEYLEHEKESYNKIRQFGKCGVAYARFERFKDLISSIEQALNKVKQK